LDSETFDLGKPGQLRREYVCAPSFSKQTVTLGLVAWDITEAFQACHEQKQQQLVLGSQHCFHNATLQQFPLCSPILSKVNKTL
jgi:hypothetical protein